MTKACKYSQRDGDWGGGGGGGVQAPSEREEIKRKNTFQYELICEHNAEAAFEAVEIASSSGRSHSQPRQLKIHTGSVWSQYHFP